MSDILIRGMEMPTDCAMMLKIFPDGKVGVPVHLNWEGTMVVNDAEAVSVPPHYGRLIDADAFLALCKDYSITPSDNEFCKRLEYALTKAPTIIPAEGEK